jgi:hypothetical protein
MTKIQIFGIILLIVLILTIDLHAESTNNTSTLKSAKTDINWTCTSKCTGWWTCRIFGWFFVKCTQPAGCDCSKFAWEH